MVLGGTERFYLKRVCFAIGLFLTGATGTASRLIFGEQFFKRLDSAPEVALLYCSNDFLHCPAQVSMPLEHFLVALTKCFFPFFVPTTVSHNNKMIKK